MNDNLISKESVMLSNIFFDTFAEVVEHYDKSSMEVWEETCTITFSSTTANIGLFDKSDIIAVYDLETHLPTIVTERIYRKNYSRLEWYRMKRYMRSKLKVVRHELGFNIKISYSKDYIDYVHYKEDWWQWALKRSKS